ncbi:MAG: cephalosporin hydroxylase family protein [Gammaproteobacteria bacterium]|nr:cephalosporin hydroxylase family protein [Gammaproteobacteria bacterium]
MSQIDNFDEERKESILKMKKNTEMKDLGLQFVADTSNYNYSYNFDWLSRPIIQYPQDIIAFQEIVWKVKPDLIIEMGIARGGSLILSASLMALLDLCENGEANLNTDTKKQRQVLGVDIDIRQHNLEALESHPLFPYINLIEGSSIDQEVIEQVQEEALNSKNILVCLDSNHTHEHVLAELEAYASLTSPSSYCIVFDTVIEDMPEEFFNNRHWGPGNSPKSAVSEFLMKHDEFEIDESIEDKLLITVAPNGYLKRKS